MCVCAIWRVNTGLFCSTPGVAVARSVPKKVALHMLLTAEPLTAQGQLLCSQHFVMHQHNRSMQSSIVSWVFCPFYVFSSGSIDTKSRSFHRSIARGFQFSHTKYRTNSQELGDGYRRVLIALKEATICYKMNEIVTKYYRPLIGSHALHTK